MRAHIILTVLPLALVAACDRGGGDQAKLDTLDNELVGNAADPALTAALEDQIMVDPALTGQARGGTTPGSVSQPIPPERRQAAEQARYALDNGRLLRTPAPGRFEGAGPGLTQGQTAQRAQGRMAPGNRGVSHACAERLDYSARWAARLPEEVSLYPNARVVEAAGGNDAPCRLRVVTFRADAEMQAVLDYYYTKTLRAGYSAEHQSDGREHMLGGTRRDDAFMLYLRNLPGGGTEVDLISNVAA